MAVERVVVVGAGGISPAWFKPLKAEGVQVAAVVDLRLEQAQKRIAEFDLAGAEASTNLAAMIRKHKPDFVIDLTVPKAHCKTTCKALELGCHVIGEKPMASSMKEARKMVAAAEKTGRLYMVSQSRRWDVKHEIVHRVIAGGQLGALTTINCDFYIGAHFGGFRDEMPSPLILDMAIHHFDLARYMSGADPVAVYAKEFNPAGSWYKGDVAASCIFEMSNGIIFTYRGSWCSEGFHTSWNGDWRFITDRGTLLYDHDQEPQAAVVANAEGFHRKMQDVPMPPPNVQYTGMHGALREMLEFLRTGRKPQCECHDNIRSLAMVFAAIESNRKGRRVAVRAL
jgi:predicted dehydrogenase